MSDAAPAVRLVDVPGQTGRTTVSLLASLAARLGALHAVTGADATGSLTAGYAALGREVAVTADGARLKEAIERTRTGANGDALWERLRLQEWASSLPPAPILDDLRNDLALLAADDLDTVLALPPAPAEALGDEGPLPAPSTFAEYLVGMWAFAHEVVRGIEALVATSASPSSAVRPGPPPDEHGSLDGPLLR
jgi:hypothetical protein